MNPRPFTDPDPAPPRSTVAGPWVVAASAVLLLLPLWHLLPPGTSAALWGEGAATVTRLACVGTALLWAAGRRGLDGRLRRSLTLIGVTSLVSAVMAMTYVLSHTLAVPAPPVSTYTVWSFVSFALLLVAILQMPMSPPLGRPEGWTFPLDLVSSIGGWLVFSLVLVLHLPLAAGATPPGTTAIAYVAANTLVLAALNLLTLRGRALPSERAFALFLMGNSTSLVSLFLRSLGNGDERLGLWATCVQSIGAVCTLWSAWAMRTDRIPASGTESPAHWIREFNPFALGMPVATTVALLHALRSGPPVAVWPLAVATAALTTLLALRLALTIVEGGRRLRAEARLEANRQAERLEALRRVAGGVAHAFNNSLTVILGETDMCLSPGGDPEIQRALERIRDAGERSASLTRHLLWFTGRQHRSRDTVATGAWLRALEPDVRALLAADVELALDAPDVPGTVTCDAAQLRATVLELVRNGVEAMPGGGRLTIALDAADAGSPNGAPAGPRHRITVRDTGRGIAPEHLSRLFEPFYSAGADSMPDSGMGLAIAHGVARAHGGTIEVESAPGRGSTFRLLLPTNGAANA